jgi:hypothetical protein
MKKILLLAVTLLPLQLSFAQVKFGVKAGLSSETAKVNDVKIFPNQDDTLSLGLQELTGGYHFGVFLNAQIKKFFIQPEVLFNSNRADFRLADLGNPNGRDEVLRERYHYLDIPVMLGFKFGALRLQGGPVGHLYLDNTSDLLKLSEYDQMFEKMTYGWQAGAGLDVWHFRIDVKYEGNFTEFGEHIRIGNEKLDFSDAPSRWLFSLGYAF